MLTPAENSLKTVARSRHTLLLWLERRGIWLVLLVAALCYALSFNPRLSGTDDATYLVAARALAAGQGFCKANLVGCPPEVYYPPGFPLLLAPFVALLPPWPQNVPWLMLIPMAFGLLSLPLLCRLLRDELDLFWGMGDHGGASQQLSLLITLAFAVSYVGTWFTFILMTETLYFFVSVLALLVLGRAERGGAPLRTYALAGVLIGCLALIRSVGLALLAAAVVVLLFRKKWLPAGVILASALVLVGPVLVRSYLITQAPAWQPYRGVFIVTYMDTFLQKHWQDTTLGLATPVDLLRRLAVNVEGHVTETLPKLLFPTLESHYVHDLLGPLHLAWTVPLFKWLVAGAAAAGLPLRLWKQIRSLDLYVLFYVGLILLPGWYTFRNLLPILPFIYLYVVWSILSIVRLLARAGLGGQGEVGSHGRMGNHGGVPPWGVILALLFVLLSAGSNLLSNVRGNFEMGARYRASGLPYVEEPSFFEACQWIGDHTQPDAQVVYRSSEKMYLCSGRRAPASLSTMPVSLNGRDHARVIEAVYSEADIVILSAADTVEPPLTDSEPVDYQSIYFLQPVVEGDRESFGLRYQTVGLPRMRIYQVLR